MGASPLALKCLLKLRQIRRWADDPVFGDRVRVGLHHQALLRYTTCPTCNGNWLVLVTRNAVILSLGDSILPRLYGIGRLILLLLLQLLHLFLEQVHTAASSPEFCSAGSGIIRCQFRTSYPRILPNASSASHRHCKRHKTGLDWRCGCVPLRQDGQGALCVPLCSSKDHNMRSSIESTPRDIASVFRKVRDLLPSRAFCVCSSWLVTRNVP